MAEQVERHEHVLPGLGALVFADKLAEMPLPRLAVIVLVGNLDEDVVEVVDRVHQLPEVTLLELENLKVRYRAEALLPVCACAGVSRVAVHSVEVVVPVEGMEFPEVRVLEHPSVHGDELKKQALLAGRRAQIAQTLEECRVELAQVIFGAAVVGLAGSGPQKRLDVLLVVRRRELLRAPPEPDARDVQAVGFECVELRFVIEIHVGKRAPGVVADQQHAFAVGGLEIVRVRRMDG